MLAGVRIPVALFKIVREVARHVLRRPVVGVCAAARTLDGRWVLIRRADTGGWALPGGTLEWGETLRTALARELEEETGAKLVELGRLVGVYSGPERDARFHSVTIVVEARVDLREGAAAAVNPLEILEVRAFTDADLPAEYSYQMKDMMDDARAGRTVWE
jgi:8-oxo-dGTP diphosphatase